jgi:hypothetical protein
VVGGAGHTVIFCPVMLISPGIVVMAGKNIEIIFSPNPVGQPPVSGKAAPIIANKDNASAGILIVCILKIKQAH